MSARAASSRAATQLRRNAGRPADQDVALPPEFDLEIYRNHPGNADVRDLDGAAARAHYMSFGRQEGRICSAIASRADFVALVPRSAEILEIGPFCSPAFPRAGWPTVRYLDALSTGQLRARAKTMSWAKPEAVPDIDYVWQGQPYAALTGRSFDIVYSSHVIEHAPCLVKHLREVGSILKPGGRYLLTIPDKRYDFDHHIPETTIADVLDAFLIGRTNRHSARDLINEALYHVHNEPPLHWAGDHWPDPKQRPVTPELMDRLSEVIERYQKNEGYVDAHAWLFTPTTFRTQIDIMSAGRMIPFVRERVYDTLHMQGEFFAVLRAGFPAGS